MARDGVNIYSPFLSSPLATNVVCEMVFSIGQLPAESCGGDGGGRINPWMRPLILFFILLLFVVVALLLLLILFVSEDFPHP